MPGSGFSTMRVIRPTRAAHAVGLDDAVAADVGRRHGHDADHRVLLALGDLGHLPHHRHRGVDQVVGEQHGERLVADHRLGAEHRVPQPQRLGLADVDAVDAAAAWPICTVSSSAFLCAPRSSVSSS